MQRSWLYLRVRAQVLQGARHRSLLHASRQRRQQYKCTCHRDRDRDLVVIVDAKISKCTRSSCLMHVGRWRRQQRDKGRNSTSRRDRGLVRSQRANTGSAVRPPVVAIAALFVLNVQTQVPQCARRGAIPPLIALLSSPMTVLQEHATGSLRTLSADVLRKFMIATADAILPLITLLSSPSSARVQEAAAGPLKNHA
jgi:hypothetical protein